MPFLLMFWKPIAGVLLVIALVAAVGLTKHRYDEGRRDEGRVEVQAKWDAAIVVQKEREVKAAKDAEAMQLQAETKRDADFKQLLAARTAEIKSQLASRSISSGLTVQLRNTTRAANSGVESTRKPAEDSATVAGPPTELAIAEWYDQVAKQYRACREQVIGWIKWDNERVGEAP